MSVASVGASIFSYTRYADINHTEAAKAFFSRFRFGLASSQNY